MKVFIDSNIFVYAAFHHELFGNQCRTLLEQLETRQFEAVTSVIVLSEVHHVIQKYESKQSAELAVQSIISMPILIVPLDVSIFQGALNQVRKHGFEISDAIHFAAARAMQCERIYSYDKDFSNLEIPREEPS